MDNLVTLRQAKDHLGLSKDVSVDDGELKSLLAAAHKVVEKFVKQRRTDAAAWAAEVDAWTEQTAPDDVKGQIKLAFGWLYRHKGDDDEQMAATLGMGELPREFTALIWDRRDPAIS